MIAGVSVPSVDGILLEGGELYAVQNFLNQIAVVRLSPDLTSGTVEERITSELFQIPTTVARFGDRLATVNAKFDTGFPPTPTSMRSSSSTADGTIRPDAPSRPRPREHPAPTARSQSADDALPL